MTHPRSTGSGHRRLTLPREGGTASPLPLRVTLAFAPLHKRAFGLATGMAAGIGLFAITIAEMVRSPSGASGLQLLSQYFAGYTVSPRGAFVGLLWGLGTGFVLGWFVAFCRNLVVAASIFWIRTRAELRQTREFLDHI